MRLRARQSESTVTLFLGLSLWIGVLLACSFNGEPPNPYGMFGGTAMVKAGAELKQKLGGPFKVLNVEIIHDSVTLRVQDPKKPANVDEYRYWATLRSFRGPSPVELSSLDANLDNTLFDFDSVNWEATESLARAALERTQIDGGKIDKITVERKLPISGTAGDVQWTIEVSSPREHATAYADPQGKSMHFDLSHTARAAKFTLFSAEALREAVSQFDSVFGGHAKVMDFEISDKSLGFKAPDPKTGEISHYHYDINGLADNVILDLYPDNNVTRLQQDHKIDEILFDLDAIKLEQAPEIGQRAVQRLGLQNSLPDDVRVKRDELGQTTKLTTFWEVDCRMGRKWGTVSYDLEGKELGVRIQ